MHFAIFGDVSGWTKRLEDAIYDLGGDPTTGTLPSDLTIIQVGDLIDKGPDSEGAIDILDRMCTWRPAQWLQMIGNHEAAHLGGPVFQAALGRIQWKPLSQESQEKLIYWFSHAKVRIACALNTEEIGETLITHAGLCYEKWDQLGKPATAQEAAYLLNLECWNNPATAYQAGIDLQDFGAVPGVCWTDVERELMTGWVNRDLPFSQVHGHRSLYNYDRGSWRYAHERVRNHVDTQRRQTFYSWPNDKVVVGIDPCYSGKAAPVPLSPLLLTGEVLA